MVTVGFKKGAKVERIEADLKRPQKLLKQIGQIIKADAQRTFDDQKLTDQKLWRPRSVPNVMGIVADAAQGSNPKPHRLDARPALKDTGRLMASFGINVGATSVTVGNSMEYASLHQTGGTSESAPITPEMQDIIAEWLTGDGVNFQQRLGFLLSPSMLGKTVQTRVPPRPMLSLHKQLRKDIKEIIGVEVFEVGKRGRR